MATKYIFAHYAQYMLKSDMHSGRMGTHRGQGGYGVLVHVCCCVARVWEQDCMLHMLENILQPHTQATPSLVSKPFVRFKEWLGYEARPHPDSVVWVEPMNKAIYTVH